MSAKELRVFHRLQLAAHRVRKAADRKVAGAIDLTTSQAGVLSVLSGAEGFTQKEIALELGLNESAVTAMVNRLLRLGYVSRQRSTADARAWVILISPEGRDALRKAGRPFASINKTIESVLTEREVENLADYLSRISDAFTESS